MGLRDDDRLFTAGETFEGAYFGPDMYSDVSWPRGMNQARFQSFHDLLCMKRKGPVYCMAEGDDGVSLELLVFVDEGFTQRIELIRIREVGGDLRIVSSYLTNFEGTFIWNAGEDVGETLRDPCASSAT